MRNARFGFIREGVSALKMFVFSSCLQRNASFQCFGMVQDHPTLAWLGFAWLGLAWLGLACLGLARLGLAGLGLLAGGLVGELFGLFKIIIFA